MRIQRYDVAAADVVVVYIIQKKKLFYFTTYNNNNKSTSKLYMYVVFHLKYNNIKSPFVCSFNCKIPQALFSYLYGSDLYLNSIQPLINIFKYYPQIIQTHTHTLTKNSLFFYVLNHLYEIYALIISSIISFIP